MVRKVQVFQESFERAVSADPDAFFERFYETFTGNSPEVADRFKNVDWARQRKALMSSLAYLTEYAAIGESSAYLRDLAERHDRRHLDIPPRLYDLWLEALVQTVRDFDGQCDDQVIEAWKATLAPGMAYMKSKY